jgi:hypothetical protein
MKKYVIPCFIVLLTLIFFWKFIFQGLLPIPADTIPGLYYPYREIYSNTNPNGIPFKNFLITDPVRQHIPWRKLIIEEIKQKQLPLWNPYTFAGYPLFANIQSAPLYIFNFLFIIFNFNLAWSALILIQILFAGLGMFAYLKKIRLTELASLLGAITYMFSGIMVAWLTWGTIGHVLIWLPVLLLVVESVFEKIRKKSNKAIVIYTVILSIVEFIMWSAGHFQISLYVTIFLFLYAIAKTYLLLIRSDKKNRKNLTRKLFLFYSLWFCLTAVFCAILWVPLVNFLRVSYRIMDVNLWLKEGWFIPWKHLVQFLVPDYFGNPSTMNYWGTWNYGELVGYMGVGSLMLVFLALFGRKDKKTLFYGSMFFLLLFLATPTYIAKLPFLLNMPIFSVLQPTRYLSLIVFSLCTLSALGFDSLLCAKISLRLFLTMIIFYIIVFLILWIITILGKSGSIQGVDSNNFSVAFRNLILPTLTMLFSTILLLILFFRPMKKRGVKVIASLLFLLILTFDLIRFGWKFTPFVKAEYLYPETDSIQFLKNKEGIFRIMSTDDTIFPPNMTIMHKLQTLDGYDPLFLSDYGKFIAAWKRNKPDISYFDFNRIITVHDFENRFADLLGVKYVISKAPLDNPKLTLIHTSGSMYIYENNQAFPRAFFVEGILNAENPQKAIELLFEKSINLNKYAVVINAPDITYYPLNSEESVEIQEYSSNKILVQTKSDQERFLVLSDAYYPSWKAYINGVDTPIYKTNFAFRGILVPKGNHTIIFQI